MEFSESFDARVWAKAFVEHASENPDLASDEETMTSWFANALMRGYDEREKKVVRDREVAEQAYHGFKAMFT